MREILFRGKRTDNGGWIEGSLLIYNDIVSLDPDAEPVEYWIMGNSLEQVIPETVGQYTGMNDENGKKIFEGDIFEEGTSVIHGPDRYEIAYINASFCFRNITKQNTFWTSFGDNEFGLEGRWCTVIGNIHDNPELLEVDSIVDR